LTLSPIDSSKVKQPGTAASSAQYGTINLIQFLHSMETAMTLKPRSATPALSMLMLSLLLAGCASEKALLTQTQPLQDRIDRVEQNLTSSSAENQRALAAQADRLAARQQEIAQQLADLKQQLIDLQSKADVRQRSTADALSRLATQDEKLGYRLDGLQRDLADAAALARNNAEQQASNLARQERDAAIAAANAAGLIETQARIHELKQNTETAASSQVEQLHALQQQTATNLANAIATEQATERARFEAAQQASRQQQAATEERLRAAEDKLNTLSGLVHEALALAAKELFLANGKEAFSVMLTDDKVLYPQNDPNLDPRDVAKLSELAGKLAKLDQEYHLDIQGHTANTSTDDNNYSLGKARAEVVKRHLHEKQGISLSRMSTLSYGANKPLDSGSGNRRIFIRVLVLK
jgi:outer membrane protein OmpA-like peptidoglycan-associated protein